MQTYVLEKQWYIKPQTPELQQQLSNSLNISPVTAQLLINRGISTPEEGETFLKKELSYLHNPFLMEDMEKVLNRLLKAIYTKELITIYGDYDTDGICSIAILMETIRKLGGICKYYIPLRQEEGYGLNKEAIEHCARKGTKLLITVDCGIFSPELVEYAQHCGMDVIITDHHIPSTRVPKCIGILNPKLDNYPFKELAGVGVVYKLIQALAQKGYLYTPERFLDLVAIGTVADIVELTGENRILVVHGMKQLEITSRIGLIKLMKSCGISAPIKTAHIGFRIGPRLNASGRLDSAERSLTLLLTESFQEADECVTILNRFNYERQRLEQEVLKEVLEKIELNFNFNTDRVIVVANENWPVGVVGIVASRLVEKFHRPAIVIGIENGIGKGSCRSIKKFHIFDALNACRKYFRTYGGHSIAAGFTIESFLIPQFREAINEYALDKLKPEDLLPTIEIDAILDPSCITPSFFEELQMLEPFGVGNPTPLFLSENGKLSSEPCIVGNNHLKFDIQWKDIIYPTIGFGMGDYISFLEDSANIHLVYKISIDKWSGRENIQLQIVDIKIM